MRKIIFALIALSTFNFPLSTVSAQAIGGRVIMAPTFNLNHKLMLSQTDNSYGTARSAAMGGAFTSLGADLSSMSINPAGLGMYQSSDWGVTASLNLGLTDISSPGMAKGSLRAGGRGTTFAFNNVGFAWNLFNNNSGIGAMTIGFAYNRVANFNSTTHISTTGERSSIADMFARQLDVMNSEGVGENALKPDADPFYNEDIKVWEWGALMGYQSGLVGFDSGGGKYLFNGVVNTTNSYMDAITRGGIHEYDLSLGMNIADIVYLGATLGASNVNYNETLLYEEEYMNASSAIGSMWLDQRTKITGWGFTAKFGAVIRPIPQLRIGAAFHLPTYWATTKTYWGEMDVDGTKASIGDDLVDDQLFNSAPRLSVGASAVIAGQLILAADYEVAWYNKMRDRTDYDLDNQVSQEESAAEFKPGHTVRIGAEWMAHERVSLRVGATRAFDFLRHKDATFSNPVARSNYSISAGLGFNMGKGLYLDMTYVYNRTKYAAYDMYYHSDNGSGVPIRQWDTVGGTEADRTYSPRINRHMVSLTLGSRF